MTVDAPEFDEDLTYHAAVVLGGGDDSMCHAVVSGYDEGGSHDETECGVRVQDSDDLATRESFEKDCQMCPDCWPESVTLSDESE